MTAIKHYHLIRSGKEIGAFPEPAIQLMLDSGRLEPDDLCWAEGMADWRPVSERLAGPDTVALDGRSRWASAAGFLGVSAVALLPAPLAVVVAVVAILDIRKSLAAGGRKSGMGLAIFGLISGLVCSLVLVAVVVFSRAG
jgi:hypothetical protein